jgi:hypothetical protein
MLRAAVSTALSSLAGGCAAPPSQTAPASAARVEQSGPGCGVCIMQNPGNVRPCEQICGEYEVNQVGYWAGAALH